jgi:hypothetical protein
LGEFKPKVLAIKLSSCCEFPGRDKAITRLQIKQGRRSLDEAQRNLGKAATAIFCLFAKVQLMIIGLRKLPALNDASSGLGCCLIF